MKTIATVSTPIASLVNRWQHKTTVETTAVGFSSPESHRRTAAMKRFFHVRMPLRVSYGWATVGASSDAPGSYVSGLLTPLYARPPHLAVGSGLITHIGGQYHG